jgi:hypothetical protein
MPTRAAATLVRNPTTQRLVRAWHPDHGRVRRDYFDIFSITENSACVPSRPRPAAWALANN